MKPFQFDKNETIKYKAWNHNMALFSFDVYNPHTNATMIMKNMDGETALLVLKHHGNYKFLNSTIQMFENGIESTIYHNMPEPDPENDPENPFGKNYVHEELDVKDKDYFRLAITKLAMLGEYENHENDK